MNDLISKQAAINTVFAMCCRWDTDDKDDLKNLMLTAFQDLPTIEAIPIEWIEKQKAECYPYSITWLCLKTLLETWREENEENKEDG